MESGRDTVINALGESTSIFAGVILLKQVGSLIKESQCLKTVRVSIEYSSCRAFA